MYSSSSIAVGCGLLRLLSRLTLMHAVSHVAPDGYDYRRLVGAWSKVVLVCVNVVAVSRHGSLVGAVRWLAVLEVAPPPPPRAPCARCFAHAHTKGSLLTRSTCTIPVSVAGVCQSVEVRGAASKGTYV
jgi:hypothetical protein